jgi:hypothetical protein
MYLLLKIVGCDFQDQLDFKKKKKRDQKETARTRRWRMKDRFQRSKKYGRDQKDAEVSNALARGHTWMRFTITCTSGENV